MMLYEWDYLFAAIHNTLNQCRQKNYNEGEFVNLN